MWRPATRQITGTNDGELDVTLRLWRMGLMGNE